MRAGPRDSADTREHLRDGVDTVWVAGGDGTVAQVATALVDTPVPIGILPTGTVNVVAVECGIPSHPFRALQALSRAPAQRIFRTWAVGERAVLLGVGVEFEARAIGNVHPLLKDWLGFWAVGGQGVAEWLRYEFPLLRVCGKDARGVPFETCATQVLVTNPRRYAGPHVVAPRANPADDHLEVVLFRGASRQRLARFWAGVELPGTLHLRVPGVSVVRARSLRIAAADAEPIRTHVNGDAVEHTPVSVRPWGAVRLLVPAASDR